MTGDLHANTARRRRSWRRNWISGIRTRVLAIALIPSVVLVITGAVVVANLISEGISARNYSAYLKGTSTTIVGFTTAMEQERTLSLLALGGYKPARADLPAQWAATNKAVSAASTAAAVGSNLNSKAFATRAAQQAKLFAGLGLMRKAVQAGKATATQVDAFYTQFAEAASTVFLSSALSAPNAATAVGEAIALDLYTVPDVHSRVAGLGGGWAARGKPLPQADRVVLAQLTGTYQNELQALATRLPASVEAGVTRLEAGNAWKIATTGEADLAQQGKLSMPFSSWLAAENTVSADLPALFGDDLRSANAAAQVAASQTVSRAVLVGSLVLALALIALITTIVLANRLVRRLRRLRSETLQLADVTLPSLVRRIGDGEVIDVTAEVAMSGYGKDEIGQVAEAFNTAQRTVVAIATAEAGTRTGTSKVFLDIAHRSQLVVHRQLELLDLAEAKQSDPEHLELLFKLDHLATRARRNAENLLILGGGQPGRKWRRSAGLEDIVRSAGSETEEFARVAVIRLPDVQIQGAVVGDLIHLLAELIDNATAFSPPDAVVTVRGNIVGKGVVVEVEDQGLGIALADRERLNETLRNPLGFQEMALSGQRHLGLFVIGQLAQRHGITVSLLESAYGGIKAIVLIPFGAIEADGIAHDDSTALDRIGLDEQRRAILAEVAADPLPLPRHSQDAYPVPPTPSWTDPQAPATLSPPWDTILSDPALQPAGRTRTPLPRRERMANLAPGLRINTEAPDSTTPRRARSPEEARGSMSAFQRGTRLARNYPGQDDQSTRMARQ